MREEEEDPEIPQLDDELVDNTLPPLPKRKDKKEKIKEEAPQTTKEERKSGPEELKSVFKSFTGNTIEMDGRQFAKLCKDTKLIGGGFTTTDVDLIFAKVKDTKARKINFNQFKTALDHVGAKKGKTGDEIAEDLIAAGGPQWSGTKAEATRFHDDKS